LEISGNLNQRMDQTLDYLRLKIDDSRLRDRELPL